MLRDCGYGCGGIFIIIAGIIFPPISFIIFPIVGIPYYKAWSRGSHDYQLDYFIEDVIKWGIITGIIVALLVANVLIFGISLVVGILYLYCAYCYDENKSSRHSEGYDYESKWKSSSKYHTVTEYEKPRKNLSQTSHHYKDSTYSISKRERIIDKSACVYELEEKGFLEKNSEMDKTSEGLQMRIDLIQQLLDEKSSTNMNKRVRSLLIGAIGELRTLISLIELGDEYYIINDVTLEFNPPIWDRDYDEPICSAQIDHIVVGPSGVFVIESKYWSHSTMIDKMSSDFTPLMQARRNGKSVWFYLGDEIEPTPFVKSIISLSGSASLSGNNWVDVLSAKDVAKSIRRRKKRLTSVQIESIVECL